MKTILLIHGPNLNVLGRRNHSLYGKFTLFKLEQLVKKHALRFRFKIKTFQSNYEGAIIDFIQKNTSLAHGIVINPGAFAHYSFAIHDAILDSGLPTVEVHLSDITKREEWRRVSVTAKACIAMISGKKGKSYLKALELLHKKYELKN